MKVPEGFYVRPPEGLLSPRRLLIMGLQWKGGSH
jgi:hypothetical protein